MYRKGFYTHRTSSKEKFTEPIIASSDKNFIILPEKTKDSVKVNECNDSIWYKDGRLVTGKVISKGPFLLKIQACSDTGSKRIKVSRSELKRIKYQKEKEKPAATRSSELANTAFSFTILALIFLLLTIITGINPAFFSLNLFGGAFYIFLFPALTFGILAGMFACFAFSKSKKDPEGKKGKFKTFFAFIVATIFIGFILSVLIFA